MSSGDSNRLAAAGQPSRRPRANGRDEIDRAAHVFERARRIEEGQGIRRHHFVPESYLSRWNEDGRIRATEVDLASSRLKPPKSIAYEEDFYRLEAEGLDNTAVPELAIEVLFSEIEDEAKPGFHRLIAGQGLTTEEREYAAFFIAFQFTRAKRFRNQARGVADQIVELERSDDPDERIRAVLRERGHEASDEDLAIGRRFLAGLDDGSLNFSPPDAELASMAGEYGAAIWPLLMERSWCVYETPPLLITSDEPVVPIGGPTTSRGEIGSIVEAPVVILPLCPDRLLVLLRPDLTSEQSLVLNHVEVADINLEMLASSYRWAFEKPSRQMTIRLNVPKAAPALARSRTTALHEPGREVWHLTRPSRWQSAPSTPWPVARWWQQWR